MLRQLLSHAAFFGTGTSAPDACEQPVSRPLEVPPPYELRPRAALLIVMAPTRAERA
jgi:hypothetical protein